MEITSDHSITTIIQSDGQLVNRELGVEFVPQLSSVFAV